MSSLMESKLFSAVTFHSRKLTRLILTTDTEFTREVGPGLAYRDPGQLIAFRPTVENTITQHCGTYRCLWK